MANDLAAMKSRIASELRRTDLTTEIANAITDAILVYQKERFRFSETVPNAPQTFDTVANQSVYDFTANANIKTVLAIDYINYVLSNTVWRLVREQPETLKLWNQQTTMVGQPSWFAYEGNEIILSPIPNTVYTMTLGAFFVVAAPQSDSESGNPWMTDAERLIRARAKYEIAVHLLRNPSLAQSMSPNPPADNGGVVGAAYREWKALKGEANRITGRGIIRPMRF